MTKTKTAIVASIALVYLFSILAFASAVSVTSDYITIYPGEQGQVSIKLSNNENFDIEQVSLSLKLSGLPFTAVGSSAKSYDDLGTDDHDSKTFTLKASTGITPGDYNIPYVLTYTNADNNNQTFTENGSFGIRVSAKTDLDFSVETDSNAVVGNEGRITIEVINRGLGDVKSLSVQIIPNGFNLLSTDKSFIGTISADDSDTATFDVIYSTPNPTFSAKINYKDFDNNDQTQVVNFNAKVYSRSEALRLGLIQKPSYTIYIILAVLILAFIVWRIIKRRRKNQRS